MLYDREARRREHHAQADRMAAALAAWDKQAGKVIRRLRDA